MIKTKKYITGTSETPLVLKIVVGKKLRSGKAEERKEENPLLSHMNVDERGSENYGPRYLKTIKYLETQLVFKMAYWKSDWLALVGGQASSTLFFD